MYIYYEKKKRKRNQEPRDTVVIARFCKVKLFQKKC